MITIFPTWVSLVACQFRKHRPGRNFPRIPRAAIALGALALLAVTIFGAGCGEQSSGATSTYTGASQLDGTPATVATTTTTASQPFVTLAWPPAPPRPARVLRVPIMMYHHVGNPPPGADRIRRGLTLSAANLDAQLAWLRQAGVQPISETQLFQALFYGVALPAHPVLLTFDDGYADNYTVALPILHRYGFTATFFIISGKVGKPEYMNWDQIVSLDRQGMDIGSHTVDHNDLTILSEATRQGELANSAAAIAGHLGHPVYWFCYPSGDLNPRVVEDVRAAGYLLATTEKVSDRQSSDAPLTLSRYRMSNATTMQVFKALVQ